GIGIRVISGAANNTIGGSMVGDRNVISGNSGDGIDISGSGTTGNVVLGNYVGTDVSGRSLIPGTVSWWKAEGNANDSVRGNGGSLVNGTGFASGLVGQAFSFDGVDDYVDLGNPTSLKLTSGITLEAWINTNDLAEGQVAAVISKWAFNVGLDS